MAEPNTPLPGPGADQLTGRVLVGRYRLNRKIAAGGMAEVWEATDETLARRVAVKLLHRHLAADESFVHRFRGEAVAAARLAHPSIVSVYDTFSDGDLEAIVMELVVGTTMRADLDEHGPMRLEAALAIGTQVADALATAHASGLVHRDVKPANILLSSDGRVLVADFGIAKAAEGNDLTSAGAMVGTAKYLAPEQVEGVQIDGRADLYALGVVLYEALTGTAPFVADTDAGTALARLHRDPTPPRQRRPEIPPAVEAVVLKAMARSRHDRYPDATAMRRAIQEAAAAPRPPAHSTLAPPPGAGVAPPAPPSTGAAAAMSPPPPPPRPDVAPTPIASAPVRRRSRRWMAVVGIIVLACVAAAFAVRSGDDEPGAGADAAPDALEIVGASSFDPQGDNGGEHEDEVPNAVDGDPATTWTSERYGDPDDMFGKDGVGLRLAVEPGSTVSGVDVTSPEAGWSAQIYVGTGDGLDDLAAWGDPVTSVADASSGVTRFALPDLPADQVLVWFTRVPSSGVMVVTDLVVHGG